MYLLGLLLDGTEQLLVDVSSNSCWRRRGRLGSVVPPQPPQRQGWRGWAVRLRRHRRLLCRIILLVGCGSATLRLRFLFWRRLAQVCTPEEVLKKLFSSRRL
eukprot:SAG22_NODE_214_length_15003_cov_18.466519_13_plen_102_part_00